MSPAAIIVRARLKVALRHATDVAGETREMKAMVVLIDKFPNLTDADLVTVPAVLADVLRDALEAAREEPKT